MSTTADPQLENDDMDVDGVDVDSPEHDLSEGLEVNSVLCRKMIAESQTPADLEHTIWRLSRLSEYELVRANNVARNKEMLANLRLNKMFEEAMGLPVKKAGARKSDQKSGGKGGGGRKAKCMRGEGEGTSSEEEEEEEEDELEEKCPAQEKRTKPTPKAAAPKEWAKKARMQLEEGNFGLHWSELVEQ